MGDEPLRGAAKVPAWAETERRKTVAQQMPQQRGVDPHRWLDEPWDDLAKNLPGYGLLREATKRRRAGQDDLSWRTGADGEDVVATTLRALTHPGRTGWGWRRSAPAPVWRVLHGVKLGSAAVADLDHVLIGPPGLIVINTKKLDPRHRVTLRDDELYNGRYPTGYLQNSLREARRASKLLGSALAAVTARTARGDLPISWDLSQHQQAIARLATRSPTPAGSPNALPVIPAIVFVGSGSVDEQPSPVLVARNATLCRRLQERRTALPKPQVAALYEIARRSTIWTRDLTAT